jgi:hypothetical protein
MVPAGTKIRGVKGRTAVELLYAKRKRASKKRLAVFLPDKQEWGAHRPQRYTRQFVEPCWAFTLSDGTSFTTTYEQEFLTEAGPLSLKMIYPDKEPTSGFLSLYSKDLPKVLVANRPNITKAMLVSAFKKDIQEIYGVSFLNKDAYYVSQSVFFRGNSGKKREKQRSGVLEGDGSKASQGASGDEAILQSNGETGQSPGDSGSGV